MSSIGTENGSAKSAKPLRAKWRGASGAISAPSVAYASRSSRRRQPAEQAALITEARHRQVDCADLPSKSTPNAALPIRPPGDPRISSVHPPALPRQRHCGWVHGVSLAHLPTSKRVYHEIRSYPALLVCPYGSPGIPEISAQLGEQLADYYRQRSGNLFLHRWCPLGIVGSHY
jgi:hypothetical protein